MLRDFRPHSSCFDSGEFLSSSLLDVVPLSEWFDFTVNPLSRVTSDLIQDKSVLLILVHSVDY